MSFKELVSDLKSNQRSFEQFVKKASQLDLTFEQCKELINGISAAITAGEVKDEEKYKQFAKHLSECLSEGMLKHFSDLFKDRATQTLTNIHTGNENAPWMHTSNSYDAGIQKLISMHRSSAAPLRQFGIFGGSGPAMEQPTHRKEQTPPDQTPSTTKRQGS